MLTKERKMKRIGELALPVFCRAVDSLDRIAKSVLPDMSHEERKKFYEDVKRDLVIPEYQLCAHMYHHR
jgi:hypothetical protein